MRSLLLLLPLAVPTSLPQDTDVPGTYRAAFEARDRSALLMLWRDHPGSILGTFDADLEAGLAAWEKGEDGHEAKTAALFERALFGAEAASAQTGHAIYREYAMAFTSWNAEQRKSFRAGQAAFGAARAATREGAHEEALAQGTRCRTLALDLGDWWGAAMGHQAEGGALLALDRPAEACRALSLARLIYRDLGLTGSELRCLEGLIEGLGAQGLVGRQRAAVQSALALAEGMGREERAAELRELAKSLQKD